MELSSAAGSIKPIRRKGNKAAVITHLLFADDMLIFSEGIVSSLMDIDTLLEQLATNTGLTINKEKRRMSKQRKI